MSESIGKIYAEITGETKGLSKALHRGKSELRSFGKSSANILNMIPWKTIVIGAVAGAAALALLVKSVITSGIEFERMEKAMITATGSFGDAMRAQKFLRAESERLGLVYKDQIKGYSQLAASVRSWNQTTEETQEMYKGVAESAAAMQLSQADANGVFLAFSQIASKGKVQAEELRGQIGERIPGAFDIAAKSVGKTTSELSKMLEMGQVLSKDFLPKFVKQLRIEFADAAIVAADSSAAAINRMTNSIDRLKISFAEAGILYTFTSVIKEINNSLSSWMDNNEALIRQKTPEYIAMAMSLMSESVLMSIEAMAEGLRGLNIVIHTVRGSFGTLAESYGKMSARPLELAIQRNLQRMAELEMELQSTWKTFSAGGREQLLSQLDTLEAANQKMRESLPYYKETEEAGRLMAEGNAAAMEEYAAKIDVAKLKINELRQVVLNFQKGMAASLAARNQAVEEAETRLGEEQRTIALEAFYVVPDAPAYEPSAAEKKMWEKMNKEMEESKVEVANDTMQRIIEIREKDIEDLQAWADKSKGIISDLFYDILQGSEISFKSIGDKFMQMIDRMVADALAAQLTDKLFGSSFKGGGEEAGKLGDDSWIKMGGDWLAGKSGALLESIGGLFSNWGGEYAEGGRPPVGRPSLVGENGPEIFNPDSAGTVIPNSDLVGVGGVNVSVNVPADRVNNFRDSASQIGKKIGDQIMKAQRRYS